MQAACCSQLVAWSEVHVLLVVLCTCVICFARPTPPLTARGRIRRYAFHAGWQPDALKRAIRAWQFVQLLGGSALAAAALGARAAAGGAPCSTGAAGALGVASEVVPIALFLTYFGLFRAELAAAAAVARQRRE